MPIAVDLYFSYTISYQFFFIFVKQTEMRSSNPKITIFRIHFYPQNSIDAIFDTSIFVFIFIFVLYTSSKLFSIRIKLMSLKNQYTLVYIICTKQNHQK